MRPFRLLLSLTSCVLAITFLLYVSITDASEPETDHPDSEDRKSGLGALFSFHGPLFPPSAIISLTDDNSTFFLARPAAFGPLLPSRGLSGQLWIGSGFANDAYDRDGLDVYSEGQLGCSDVPGWNERFGGPRGRAKLDDLMNRHYRKSTGAKIRNAWRSWSSRGAHYDFDIDATSKDYPLQVESNTESLEERADIAGKIVLLSRGGCGFLEKVEWAQRRGGVGVIIGDNIRGGPIITMYARGDTSNVTIPGLFTSRTTAHLLSTLVPKGGTIGPIAPEVARRLGLKTSSNKGKKAFTDKIESAWPVDSSATSSTRPFAGGAFARVYAAWFGSPNVPEADSATSQLLDIRADAPSEVDEPPQISTTEDWYTSHNGLWVTLTPTNMSSNPFLDTLLVLVVSPLVTLTVVYALLLLRSRMQRRRWRAPKSVVERLPVRTYHTLPSSSQLATPIASSPTTPLLQSEHRPLPQSPTRYDTLDIPSSSDGRHQHDPIPSHDEKRESGLAEWRRRYGGRQRECVVCLEEYEDGVSRVMSLPCGHEFHAECITPWLTTRRRTCPICKGDVVRSMARNTSAAAGSRSESPAGGSRRRNRLRRADLLLFHHHSANDEDSGSEGSASDDDVQTQAANRRNDSPSAAMPIPTAPDALIRDEDLERGVETASAPEVRPRTERSTIWRTVGSWGLPGLGTLGRDGQRGEHRVDRDR